MYDLKLLDCTLRDGGYINDWNWGYQVAKEIIQALVRAKIEIVEVGFLRNNIDYNPDIVVCSRIEELNYLLPVEKNGSTKFSAMAMVSNYDASNLSNYNGSGIEMIRVTAHDYDIEEGIMLAKKVKDKGYKVSVNPINIMGYSDERLLSIIDRVNSIQPYQFAIVDTFGSMKRRDLDRIVSIVDNNMDRNVRLALHLHENMSLSCSLAQNFVDKHLDRPLCVDASLMGMGRTPGNLPIELIADYLNDYGEKAYDIDSLMDAIQEYISAKKGNCEWGYNPVYFLSARHNLHRNYAENYLGKGDLSNKDINHILAGFERKKCTAYDEVYADKMYEQYKKRRVDDSISRGELKEKLVGKNILLLAPGHTIVENKASIDCFIRDNKPTVISVNFIPESIRVDYAFFSNNKRYKKEPNRNYILITTSNIDEDNSDYVIDYNSLSVAFEEGYNGFVMLLKLLSDLNIHDVHVAGADGYTDNGYRYCTPAMTNVKEYNYRYNTAVAKAIRHIGMNVEYITPSQYQRVPGKNYE